MCQDVLRRPVERVMAQRILKQARSGDPHDFVRIQASTNRVESCNTRRDEANSRKSAAAPRATPPSSRQHKEWHRTRRSAAQALRGSPPRNRRTTQSVRARKDQEAVLGGERKIVKKIAT